MKKFAFIGAGSMGFTRHIVRDLLTYPAFEDCEIRLMDIDPLRLEWSAKCVNRIVEAFGNKAKVVCTLSREEALEAYTSGSAWLQFKEDFLGRLAPGYAADLQLLDRDYFTCPREEIGSIRPVLVMAAGKPLLREI